MKTPPVLAIVLAGNDPASLSYVKRKEQTAKKLGCEAKLFHMLTDTNEAEIITLIKKINTDKKILGMIVQLPLPDKFNTDKIISMIKKSKDVDNLRGDSPFISPSTQAIWTLINVAGNPRTQRVEQSRRTQWHNEASHDGSLQKSCALSATCPTRASWNKADDAIRKALSKIHV